MGDSWFMIFSHEIIKIIETSKAIEPTTTSKQPTATRKVQMEKSFIHGS